MGGKEEGVGGDLSRLGLSLVVYRQEGVGGEKQEARHIKVGFVGTAATHLPELFNNAGDFGISGEPEAAAIRIAAGEDPNGLGLSPQINDLDSLPFPRWDLNRPSGHGYTSRSGLGITRAFPLLTSRSCPEKCTYCPHLITADFRARSAHNVLDEMQDLCARHKKVHAVLREP